MNDELVEIKREINKEIDVLIREHKVFKRRISTIANFFLPGMGFIIYGSSYLKGFITLALYILYNLFYFYILFPDLGEMFFRVLYYIPAFMIWLISTIMVSTLDN